MTISRLYNTKKFKIYIAIFIASISIFIPLFNIQKSDAITQQSKDNATVASLIFCLQHYISNSDDATSYTDMFDDSWDKRVAVVGVDIIRPDGVSTCNEAVAGTATAIKGTETTDSGVAWLTEQLVGTPQGFGGLTDGKIAGSKVKENADALINTILLPFIQNHPISDKDLAQRSLPLADFCFNFLSTPFTGESAHPDRNFTITGADGKTIYATSVNITDTEVATKFNMNKNGGVTSSKYTELGDIQLGFRLSSSFSIGSNFNGGWNSDFYPFGQDIVFYNGIKGDTYDTNGKEYGIVSCSWIKDNSDRLFPFYQLNAAGELTVDGLTSADIEDQGEVLLGFADGEENPTCESKGTFSLSWIACPIINGALDSMDWLFKELIEPFLITQPLTTNDGDFVYDVWKSFRTIGNILLAFTLLFVVFGQAIGGGMVDAYTAKKAIPRILAAAILINLSYFGVALMVDIFNVLGAGVGTLITAPLQGAGSFSFSPNNFVSAGGLLAVGLGGKWLLGLTATSGFLPLLFITVILPMLLVVISIFGTLIVRRGLIIMLAVLAPVAAVLFVLPNTEKYAKQWFSLFIKTLVVYPIIMAIFGVADLMSVMLMNASASTSAGVGGFAQDSLQQFIGLIVLFVPFFLIPFSFKLAGGAIGAVSNTISSMGKKRLEHYKGNELDPHSRQRQIKDAYKSSKVAQGRKSTGWSRSLAKFQFGDAHGEENSSGYNNITGGKGNHNPTGGLNGFGRARLSRKNARINAKKTSKLPAIGAPGGVSIYASPRTSITPENKLGNLPPNPGPSAIISPIISGDDGAIITNSATNFVPQPNSNPASTTTSSTRPSPSGTLRQDGRPDPSGVIRQNRPNSTIEVPAWSPSIPTENPRMIKTDTPLPPPPPSPTENPRMIKTDTPLPPPPPSPTENPRMIKTDTPLPPPPSSVANPPTTEFSAIPEHLKRQAREQSEKDS